MAEILIRNTHDVDLTLSFDYRGPTDTTHMYMGESRPPYGFAHHRSASVEVTNQVSVFGPLLKEDPYLGALLVRNAARASSFTETVLDIFNKEPLLGIESPLKMSDIVLWREGKAPESDWSKHPHVPFRILLRGSLILGIQDFVSPNGLISSVMRFAWHIPMPLARILANIYKSKKTSFEDRFSALIGSMATGQTSITTKYITPPSNCRKPEIRFEYDVDSWSGRPEGSLLFPSDKNCYDTISFTAEGVRNALWYVSPTDPRILAGDTVPES